MIQALRWCCYRPSARAGAYARAGASALLSHWHSTRAGSPLVLRSCGRCFHAGAVLVLALLLAIVLVRLALLLVLLVLLLAIALVLVLALCFCCAPLALALCLCWCWRCCWRSACTGAHTHAVLVLVLLLVLLVFVLALALRSCCCWRSPLLGLTTGRIQLIDENEGRPAISLGDGLPPICQQLPKHGFKVSVIIRGPLPLFDCCVNVFFIVFSLSKHTHMFLYTAPMIPTIIVVFP